MGWRNQAIATPNGCFAPWKDIWSVGQGVGLVKRRETAGEIVRSLIEGYVRTVGGLQSSIG